MGVPNPLATLKDEALKEALDREVIEPFHRTMALMYGSNVRWDRYDEANPIATVLSEEINGILVNARLVVRSYALSPELMTAFALVVRHVAEYQWIDDPVEVNGVLDRERSRVRSDFHTPLESVQRPEWVEQALEHSRDREPVLRKERLRLISELEALLTDNQSSTESMDTSVANRLEWTGSTIDFVEVFESLAGKGYFLLPDGNMAELYRRLQRTFIVNREDGIELSAVSLANRSHGKRSVVLSEKLKALPEAKKRKRKSQR